MEFQSIDTVTAAFVAGCVTSVHCVGMCGPLACAVTVSPAAAGRGVSPPVASTLYHLGRMASYALVGALAGMVGQAPLAFLRNSPISLLPWILVIVFLAVAFGLDRRIPRPAAFTRYLAQMRGRLSTIRWAPPSLALGVGTPLLPCGPLYLMFGVALVAGSALRGMNSVSLLVLGPCRYSGWHKRNLVRGNVVLVRWGYGDFNEGRPWWPLWF